MRALVTSSATAGAKVSSVSRTGSKPTKWADGESWVEKVLRLLLLTSSDVVLFGTLVHLIFSNSKALDYVMRASRRGGESVPGNRFFIVCSGVLEQGRSYSWRLVSTIQRRFGRHFVRRRYWRQRRGDGARQWRCQRRSRVTGEFLFCLPLAFCYTSKGPTTWTITSMSLGSRMPPGRLVHLFRCDFSPRLLCRRRRRMSGDSCTSLYHTWYQKRWGDWHSKGK